MNESQLNKSLIKQSNNNEITSKSIQQPLNILYQSSENLKPSFWKLLYKELKIMLKLGIPLSISRISQSLINTIDTIFVGHIGINELAGANLSMCVIWILQILVFSPIWSLSAVISQSIGAGNAKLAGNWLQLTLFISTVMMIPALFGYFYVDKLLCLFETNTEVCHYAGQFSKYSSIYLWILVIYKCLKQYLSALNVVKCITIIDIIGIGLCILFNYLMIYGINIKNIIKWNGLGLIGSPIATAMAISIRLLLLYFWCIYYKKYHKKAWNGWSLDSFKWKKIKDYAKIVVPNAISDGSENLAYQIVGIMCATLNPKDVAAIACLFTLWGMLGSFCSGFFQATVIRIGNKMGEGDIYGAKIVAISSTILNSINIITALLFYIFKNEIASIFSTDKQVSSTIAQIMPILCVMFVISTFGWIANDILEGMSLNKGKGIVMVLTVWLFYLPTAFYFGFYSNLKLRYLCIGCVLFWSELINESLRTVILWILVKKSDWKQASYDSQKRCDKTPNIKTLNNNEISSMDDEFKSQIIQIEVASIHLESSQYVASAA